VLKKLAFVLLSFSVLAAGSAFAELKIAILNTQKAVLESEEAKVLLDKLQKDLKPEETEIKGLQKSILDLRGKLEKDKDILGDAEMRKMVKEMQGYEEDYKFKVNKLQKELNDRQQELFNQMAPKLDAVLKDLIAVEGYDLVMQRQTVLYTNSKHDITRKVTEKLNESK